MSEELAKLAEALAKAQTDFKHIVKDREVHAGQMRYRYADLSTVREAVNEALTKNGLAVTQTFRPTETDVMHVVTTLAHQGGGSVESSYPLKMTANHQQNGAAISYARRYSLCAILGVVAEDDTDGHAAAGTKGQATRKPKENPEQQARSWIERQKNIIREFPNRVMMTEWRAHNKDWLSKLAKEHPDLSEDFAKWREEQYEAKEAA